jgi:tetratricopeptide (TPR) repeat protein
MKGIVAMNRHWLYLGLFSLALAFGAGCSMEVPEQVLSEGVQALEKEGNYIYALVQFDKFLTKYPDHEYVPVALLHKAKCHWALREFDESLMACDRVLAAYPKTNWEFEAILLKGQILESQEKIDEAVAVYRLLQDKSTLFPQLYQAASMRLADVFVRTRRWPDAVAAYGAMIESASIGEQLKPTLYIFKGRAESEQGLTSQARASFAALQEAFPESQEAIWAKVEMARLFREEDPAASQEWLEKALEGYRQQAARIEEATAEVAETSPGLQREGAMGAGNRPLGSADQQKIELALQKTSAYAYLEMYDEARAELEELRNRYMNDARVFQFVSAQIEAIHRQQEAKDHVESASEAAVSAATAAVRSVSP